MICSECFLLNSPLYYVARGYEEYQSQNFHKAIDYITKGTRRAAGFEELNRKDQREVFDALFNSFLKLRDEYLERDCHPKALAILKSLKELTIGLGKDASMLKAEVEFIMAVFYALQGSYHDCCVSLNKSCSPAHSWGDPYYDHINGVISEWSDIIGKEAISEIFHKCNVKVKIDPVSNCLMLKRRIGCSVPIEYLNNIDNFVSKMETLKIGTNSPELINKSAVLREIILMMKELNKEERRACGMPLFEGDKEPEIWGKVRTLGAMLKETLNEYLLLLKPHIAFAYMSNWKIDLHKSGESTDGLIVTRFYTPSGKTIIRYDRDGVWTFYVAVACRACGFEYNSDNAKILGSAELVKCPKCSVENIVMREEIPSILTEDCTKGWP